ncbi:MAG: M14 family zinc carboxypeptidase [Gemmatimonadota bacterium]
MIFPPAELLLAGPRAASAGGVEIGRSVEGRPVRAFRFGTGARRISLLGGCHADEPVGPRLLRHLCGHLERLPPGDPLLTEWEWWVLPHINPDGEARNRAWYSEEEEAYDLAAYLAHAVREPPGQDIEFGFPRGPGDERARPENRAAYEWWRGSAGPFVLHASLHGMAVAGGAWFLIEPAWVERCGHLKARCAARATELGYPLHDVERGGEKGFFRLERGFCTRPDSRLMRRYFEERGEEETARRFRPSSMETIRGLGGDPLTLVSEMPLFLAPRVGETPGPPDPVAEVWRRRVEEWRELLRSAPDRGQGESAVQVRAAAREKGLRPMPAGDQMELQWTLIVAGLEQVLRESAPRRG